MNMELLKCQIHMNSVIRGNKLFQRAMNIVLDDYSWRVDGIICKKWEKRYKGLTVSGVTELVETIAELKIERIERMLERKPLKTVMKYYLAAS